MPDKKFLLTYIQRGKFHYDWFETEEELKEFILCNELEKEEIVDALEIIAGREIKIEIEEE